MKNCDWPDANVALASALRRQGIEGLALANRCFRAAVQVREARRQLESRAV
jgi:hypothetical protein